jgi:hypothetical protein
MILEIDDKIISSELFEVRFCCDLDACRGACCVEGNAGAPLEADEVDLLEEEFDNYKGYMKPEGIEAIRRQGFFTVDADGDLTTPLIDDAECAYSFEKDGVTYCAIEKAHREGKSRLLKPVSCHLYPIRLSNFRNGTTGVMLHRWSICEGARALGERIGTPVYRILREPIVRRFGEDFFRTLEEVEKAIKHNKMV